MHSSSFYLAMATFTSVVVDAHGKIAVAVSTNPQVALA